MKQKSSGSGDNIRGDKFINIFLSIKPWVIVMVTLILVFSGYQIVQYLKKKQLEERILNEAKAQEEKIRIATNSLSVKYITMKGYAIDYIVNKKKYNKHWEKILEGQSYIVNNQPFQNLVELYKKYSINQFLYPVEINGEEVDDSGPLNGNFDDEYKGDIKTLSLSGYYNDVDILISLTTAAKMFDSIKIVPFYNKFKEIKEKSGDLSAYNDQIFVDEKWMTKKDFLLLNACLSDDPFYKFLINSINPSYFPNKMIRMNLSIYLSGCSGSAPDTCSNESSHDFELSFYFPVLSTRFAVLENDYSQSISIGNLQYTLNPSIFIRIANNDIGEASNLPILIDSVFFLPKLLKPGQKILVPIYSYLSKMNSNGEVFSGNEEDNKERNNIDFITGPSVKLNNVYINDILIPIRDDKKNKSIIGYYSGEGFGSCPYVYSISSENDKWLLENHILYNKNSKNKEGLDTIPLSRFNGELMIIENDPEVSYVDYTEVQYFDGDKYISLSPNIENLSKVDKVYCTIRQGEKIHLKFPLYKRGVNDSKFIFISSGFYEPSKGIRRSFLKKPYQLH